ncbi:MAG: hypothetical protein LBK27_06175 [Treponema sp.]|jgi:tetratricopeptide (TPR) repeat protein|nr:hypothetical protein [Treponema sp.]
MPQGLKSRFKFPALPGGKDRSGLLKTVFLSGIILAVLTGAALAVSLFIRPEIPAAASFHGSLGDYDRALRRGGETPERLSRMLDRLEADGLGLEPALSVLKRRRALAQAYPPLLPRYREAAQNAAADWPHSEPLAAVAAAALLQGRALDGSAAADLRSRLPLLASAGLSPLRVSLHILLGDFKDPQSAAGARLDAGLAAALPRFRARLEPEAAEALIADMAILKLLDGDAEGAAAEIQAGLYGDPPPSPDFLRFAAEYFYDYRDPLRAAELFSRLDTPADISRQADSLWISGRAENARSLWAVLVSPAGGQQAAGGRQAETSAALTGRALYNLALSAGDDGEAAALLERLITLPPPETAAAGPAGETGIYGRIRYSRLLNAPAALAVLETGPGPSSPAPLLELELLRRRSESWEPDRVIGETWLLLGRRSRQEEIYRWGAWYFERQRRPGETLRLLRAAERQGIAAPWLRLHEALSLAENGESGGAEELLRAIPAENAGWEVSANLGRILENRRSPAAAIAAYETAASLVQDRQTAARIQLRIARCLKSLGRSQESRRVLEYARDLDPGNINVRLELDRLNLDDFPQ